MRTLKQTTLMGTLALMSMAACGGDESPSGSSVPDCIEDGCTDRTQGPDHRNPPPTPPDPPAPVLQKPDVLTISGSFSGQPQLEVGEDSTRRITIVRTLASRDVRPSPDVSDNPELAKAATWRVVRPEPGGCSWDHFASIVTNLSRTAILSVIGTDVLPGTACHEWALAVAHSGYRIEYTDVPYVLGGKASRVIVDIAPQPLP